MPSSPLNTVDNRANLPLNKLLENLGIQMYEQITSFDKNNKERIYNLLVLKGEALLKGNTLRLKQGIKDGEECSNFFTAISDQIDIIIIYFINDEISASLHERGPLIKLLDELIIEHSKNEDLEKLKISKNDLPNLFSNKTDFVIGSSFLDFKVNTFSAFELYVSDIYEELILKNPRSNKKEQKLIKLIEKYAKAECDDKKSSLLKQIKNISFYISSSEKIDYVLSRCKGMEVQINEIREFVSFYRNQRNTVHNLGINKGKSQSVTVDGIEINMEKNKPSYTSSHNSAIFACRKLMNIYEKMLISVTG